MNSRNGTMRNLSFTISLPLQLLIGLVMPDAKASSQEMAVARTILLPPPTGSVRSHSIEGADFSHALHSEPLLIFSHGFGESSLTDTAQLEDLASHGYVVAAIEHPHDAYAVWFPGDRVVRFASAQWDSAKALPKGAVAYQLAQVNVHRSQTPSDPT